jgi:SAM-dependent methyltransferase
MEDHHRHEGHHSHEAAGEADSAAMIEILDLDAEVLHSYVSDVVDWVAELATGTRSHRSLDIGRMLDVGRILDIGCGTGSGALALIRRFDGATVIGVDMSAAFLERLNDKARALGVADRIRTVQADLDEGWPATDGVDLAWASNSLHHVADPDRVLAEVFATVRPGGLLAVAEMDAFPRFLPDDLGVGRPGLERRCHAVAAELRAAELPHLGSDWGSPLRRAGFSVEAERTFTIDLTPPLPPATGRYAQASLRRVRSALDGQLSAEDVTTLDTLIDSDGADGVLRRDDLTVRAVRTVWVSRRP